LEILGKGLDATPEDKAVSTFLPIIYTGWDNLYDVGLLQDGPTGQSDGQGIVIKWNAPFACWRPELPIRQLGVKDAKLKKEALERNAFEYGYHIFKYIYNELKDTPTKLSSRNGVQMMHVQMEEMRALEDNMMNKLENVFFRSGRLRDYDSQYKWIGLETVKGKMKIPVTTPLEIPNVIEGRKPIVMIGSITPFDHNSDNILTGRDDGYSASVLSGMWHAFQDRISFNERCSMYGAFVQSVFGGMFDMSTLLAAATRRALTPRLGSHFGNDVQAWRKLVTFSIAWRYFDSHYECKWGRPDGQVRYGFIGESLSGSDVLLKKIMRFLRSCQVNMTEDLESTSGGGGYFFLPSTNMPGSIYRFGFVEYKPVNAGTPRTTLEPWDMGKVFSKWKEPLTVDESKNLELDRDQQQSWEFHPITLEKSKSIRLNFNYIGAGLVTRTMDIRDTLDPDEGWKPSDLMKSLITGWPAMYEPRGIILAHQTNPVMLNEYQDFFATEGARRATMLVEEAPENEQ
jgi:hypothetical protein